MFNLQEGKSQTEDYTKIVFRNDDVNPNTDFKELARIYEVITEYFPGSRIIQAITPFAYSKGIKDQGEIYHDAVPFKDNPLNWFCHVNRVAFSYPRLGVFEKVETASHGLVHFDHSKATADAQELSIVTSCRMLGVKTFIPPFNRWNKDTSEICRRNGIQMVRSLHWKSLEYEEFDPAHRLWYFHSWRWDSKTFRRKVWRVPLKKRKLEEARA